MTKAYCKAVNLFSFNSGLINCACSVFGYLTFNFGFSGYEPSSLRLKESSSSIIGDREADTASAYCESRESVLFEGS